MTCPTMHAFFTCSLAHACFFKFIFLCLTQQTILHGVTCYLVFRPLTQMAKGKNGCVFGINYLKCPINSSPGYLWHPVQAMFMGNRKENQHIQQNMPLLLVVPFLKLVYWCLQLTLNILVNQGQLYYTGHM